MFFSVRVIYVLWLVLAGVGTAFPGLRLWGVHLPAFLPLWAQVVFFALAALLALLPDRIFARITSFRPGVVSRVISSPLALIIVAGAFVIFRASTDLLGDGMLRGREAEMGLIRPAEVLPGYLAKWIYQVLNPSFHLSGQQAVAITSIIAGCAFLMVLWLYPRRIWSDFHRRQTARLWLFACGTTALFFGYVESYALPLVATICFLLASEAYRRGHGRFTTCALFFLLAMASHLAMIVLFPALIAISRSPAKRRNWRVAALGIIALGASAWGYWAFRASDFARETPVGSVLVPLFAEPPTQYGLLAPAHLLDLANLLLLVCPGLLVALPLMRQRSSAPRRPGSRFFWPLAVALPLCLPLLLDPKLGMARDWDLLALGLAPLVVWVAIRLSDCHDTFQKSELVLPSFASAAVLVLFVGINSHSATALARFEQLLELDNRRGGYGYDVLATWYQQHGQTEAEIRAWRNALKFGEHRRYWASLAAAYLRLGNAQEGFFAARRGYWLDTTYAYSAYYLGVAFENLSMSDSALAYYARAVNCAPENSNYRYNFALALFRAEQREPAIAHLDTLLHVIPDNALYWNALAMMLMDAKRLDQAQIAVDRAGELAPADVRTVMNRAALYHNTGNNDSALAEVSRLWHHPDLTKEQRAGLLELTQSIRADSSLSDSAGP